MPERQFNPYAFHADLTKKLLHLATICDTWDQLTTLSDIADLFYKNVDPQYQELYKTFEKSAHRLQEMAKPGPACAADHCPCPVPCTDQGGDQGGPHWDNSSGPCCDPGLDGPAGQPGRVKEPFNRGFWSRKEIRPVRKSTAKKKVK